MSGDLRDALGDRQGGTVTPSGARGAWERFFGVVNAGMELGARVGLGVHELEVDELLETAHRRTGLDDFGPRDFEEPLRVLVAAVRSEARLTELGRLATRRDLLRLLTNRLRLVDDRKRHPEIASESIRAPWIITGLPRTGTTLLFNLLALDPANRTPLTWEVMDSSPPPGRAGSDDARAAECDRALDWFGRMAPEYRKIHPIGAHLPQECIAITSHAFRSVRFHRTHHVPSYRAWLDGADMTPAYRWHHASLQHLGWGTGRARWVLKTPAHLFGLGALLAVYPDARVVQTHRDPLKSIASNTSQVVVLRRAFRGAEAPLEVDATMRRWSTALNEMMDRRDRGEIGRAVDLWHRDLIRDPIEGVRAVYAAFDAELSPDAEARMRAWVEAHPREEHGAHRYTLEGFGIDPERHGALFARYRERHGV
ncbi:MAG: sulfotransferase [Longimicrobiales bacterium]|nr:sulfotransferase [Longimicrobiales bacterium]